MIFYVLDPHSFTLLPCDDDWGEYFPYYYQLKYLKTMISRPVSPSNGNLINRMEQAYIYMVG